MTLNIYQMAKNKKHVFQNVMPTPSTNIKSKHYVLETLAFCKWKIMVRNAPSNYTKNIIQNIYTT